MSQCTAHVRFGGKADMTLCGANVRLGPKADMAFAMRNVRLWRIADIIGSRYIALTINVLGRSSNEPARTVAGSR
jgi:hypothetical protein